MSSPTWVVTNRLTAGESIPPVPLTNRNSLGILDNSGHQIPLQKRHKLIVLSVFFEFSVLPHGKYVNQCNAFFPL